MALSKEFYLEEIKSKYPNSYNEGLKDLEVKELEDMLDFLDEALEKADGGSIGIEVLFKEKMKDGGRVGFNVGGITDPQALSIYNSMSSYGNFTDQQIADAIRAAGYDAGTLGSGSTTTPTQPTTPTGGIINSQIGMNRDNDKSFDPFGPLDLTYTREAGTTPSISKDAFFGLGTLFQGKERGTLGTRMASRPQLPLPASIAAYSFSPFNPNSRNFNPVFENQLNYLEGMDGLIGMSSVGLKYGPKSVLHGKNVVSLFGTNDYEQALNDYISKLEEKGTIDGVFDIGNLKPGSATRYNKALKEIQNYYSNMGTNLGINADQVKNVLKAAKTQGISGAAAARQQQAIDKDFRDTESRGKADLGSSYDAGTYCFDPNTFVQMADGSEKKIKDMQLGDQTKGGEVTGVFQFKASDEIHDYKGVVVAGSHYVKEDGKFIMVQDSPLSVKIDKIPVVYSLDTTGRRIFINDIEFADYNGDGVAKNFLTNAGVDLTGFDTEVLRQVENRLL